MGIVATACVTVDVGGGETGGDVGGGGEGGAGGIGGTEGGIGRFSDKHAHAVQLGQLTPQQPFPFVQKPQGGKSRYPTGPYDAPLYSGVRAPV